MDSSTKDEIASITEDLVEFQTYHQGFGGFNDRSEVDACLNYIADYFDDTDLIIKRYGHEGQEFTGEAFNDNPNPVYENPKPSMVISIEDTKEPEYLLHGHIDIVGPSPDNYLANKEGVLEEEFPTEEDWKKAAEQAHFEPHIEEERIYGRGTADMKLGVASLMKLMKDLGQQENPPSVALMLVTDEEIGGFRGAGYLFKDIGYKPDFMISAEPSTTEEGFSICYKQKGNFQLRVSSEGKAGHGSRPWKGENANDKIAEWFKVYTKLKDKFPDYGKNHWVTTMNLGIIEGGTKRTSIADSSKIELGIRFTQDYLPEDIMQDIAEIEGLDISSGDVKSIADELNTYVSNYQYEVLNNEPMQITDMNNTFVQELLDITSEVVEVEVELIKRPDASDARFATASGIPSVTFGPRGMNLHGENEYADLSSIEDYYNIIKNFIEN